MHDDKDIPKIKKKVREEFLEFNINHVTIEIENSDEDCLEDTCVIKNEKHNHHHH